MRSPNSARSIALRRSLHLVSWYWPGRLKHGPAAGFKSCECLPMRPRKGATAASAEERYLAGLQLSGQVVYDIGAHIGIFTLAFARQVGDDGHVVAFEPYPPSYRRLLRNLKLNRVVHVTTLNAAVGAAAEQRVMAMQADEAGRVSLSPNASKRGMRPVGEIRVVALDGLLREGTLPPPDFIKIDVEGLEWDVLQGATELLRRHHPRLLIELHGADRDDKRANARQILVFLCELGYTVEHLESGARITPDADGDVMDGHLAAGF